jgi:hypothetical protein
MQTECIWSFTVKTILLFITLDNQLIC